KGFGGSAEPGGSVGGGGDGGDGYEHPRVDFPEEGMASGLAETSLQDPDEALEAARSDVQAATGEATTAGERSGDQFSRTVERGQRPAGEPDVPEEQQWTPQQDYPAPRREPPTEGEDANGA